MVLRIYKGSQGIVAWIAPAPVHAHVTTASMSSSIFNAILHACQLFKLAHPNPEIGASSLTLLTLKSRKAIKPQP